jgi:hypothetical protein
VEEPDDTAGEPAGDAVGGSVVEDAAGRADAPDEASSDPQHERQEHLPGT